MGEDDGTIIIFDEVYMQDIIDDWSSNYADGVRVESWYYDCRQQTVILRLSIDGQQDASEQAQDIFGVFLPELPEL